jgi:L-serine deaminase
MKLIEGKYNTKNRNVMMMIDNHKDSNKDVVISLMDEKGNEMRVTVSKERFIKSLESL